VARSPKALLGWAGACAGAFALLLIPAYFSDAARWLDVVSLQGFVGLERPLVVEVLWRVVQLGDPLPFALTGAALALFALARGYPRHALAVVVLFAGASITSQVLQPLLAFPRLPATVPRATVEAAAFPSGHATAAMSIALAAVLVAPRRLRPLAAGVGAIFVLAVSFSLVVLGWHFPSDVVAGYLVATFWALIVLAGLRVAAARWPERSGRRRATQVTRRVLDRGAAVGLTATAAASALAVSAALVLLALTRLPELIGYADRHTAFVVVAGGIAATAAALLAGMTVALNRRS
jgi:membrane-associated phospholipid phosphatase